MLARNEQLGLNIEEINLCLLDGTKHVVVPELILTYKNKLEIPLGTFADFWEPDYTQIFRYRTQKNQDRPPYQKYDIRELKLLDELKTNHYIKYLPDITKSHLWPSK